MSPLPPSIGIDALMHLEQQGELSFMHVLQQIESTSEWRAGVDRILQVLAKKHSLDYNGLMNPQPSDQQQSSFSSGVGCSRSCNTAI
ncbi:unnamed protein product [Urochloa humidicola]